MYNSGMKRGRRRYWFPLSSSGILLCCKRSFCHVIILLNILYFLQASIVVKVWAILLDPHRERSRTNQQIRVDSDFLLNKSSARWRAILREERQQNRWDWVKAPYKATGEQPTPRYQHSTLFLGPLMMVIGGRTNTVGEIVPLEIYDTESSEWYKFNSL
jgi:hypothetical protein